VIVRDNFHGLLDELMALVFEALPITVFSGIYTSSEVVVLGRRRRGPITIRRDDVVDTKLLADLLNTKMQRISFELLVGKICHDQSWKPHEACSLILLRVSPSVALLTLLQSIGRGICLNRTSATLNASISRSKGNSGIAAVIILSFITSEPAPAERNIIRAGNSLITPGHDVVFCCQKRLMLREQKLW
jgi:hypothetical protein